MIIVDVETSGLSYSRNSILSIGAVKFTVPEDTFYGECQAREGADITQGALDVNGFTREQITDPKKPTEEQLVRKFLDWVSPQTNKVFGGHVTSFDLSFISGACYRYKFENPFYFRSVDLHSLAYAKMLQIGLTPYSSDDKKLSLDNILVFVGMPKEPKPHIALNGAKYETEAFYRLIFGKSAYKEFEEHLVPGFLK